MSTTTIQQNIIYGLGEGALVADTTMLAYALRWANAAYREIFIRHRFRHLHTRAIFKTSDGQGTYQAPSDFAGFLVLKDETNDQILGQVTPEELPRDVAPVEVLDETFTSSDDTAVSLDNTGIVQYSERVCDDADETTTYTRDTDYTMGYAGGTITTISTGSITDATTTYINYLYYPTNKPEQFCLEYDATNTKYVFRMEPVPDATYVMSLLYPAVPSDLSDSVDPIWTRLEYALERGGIYYGSLEFIENAQKRVELKQVYEQAITALVQLDNDLVPKHDRIKVVMRKTDY